ncbi:MAG: PHP domain-containing protein [Euryarchaeota archaeon]|nr:PHP domain-containing protein [Euryarchaeota archaeon]
MLNLHNHTTYSDGRFSPRDIVEAAIRAGLSAVGISDHYRTKRVRSLLPSGIDEYVEHVRRLAIHYKNRIRVLVGVEIDASAERTEDIAYLPAAQLNKMDFLLFENVQDDEAGGLGLWELFDMRKELEPPVGLAHNDIARNFAEIDHSVLIPVLETSDLFLELCPSPRHGKLQRPLYRHSAEFFARLKNTKVGLSLGTDTHDSLDDVGNVDDAYAFVQEHGLEKNLIDRRFGI